MSKYESREKRAEKERAKQAHPIWQGIGCIMMVVIPILSYAIASVILEQGLKLGWPIPASLLGYPEFPQWTYSVIFINTFVGFFAGILNLKGILLFTAVIALFLFGLFSFVYILLVRSTGRGQYSEFDAPRVVVKKKRKL